MRGRVMLIPFGDKYYEESPDTTGSGCRLTAGRGNLQESATERETAYGLKRSGDGEKVR